MALYSTCTVQCNRDLYFTVYRGENVDIMGALTVIYTL